MGDVVDFKKPKAGALEDAVTASDNYAMVWVAFWASYFLLILPLAARGLGLETQGLFK